MIRVSAEARQHLLSRGRKISDEEIEEAWSNLKGPVLVDSRLSNRGRYGLRRWFISKTKEGRELVIIYEIEPKFGPILVTAFDEIAIEVKKIYEREKARQKK